MYVICLASPTSMIRLIRPDNSLHKHNSNRSMIIASILNTHTSCSLTIKNIKFQCHKDQRPPQTKDGVSVLRDRGLFVHRLS